MKPIYPRVAVYLKNSLYSILLMILGAMLVSCQKPAEREKPLEQQAQTAEQDAEAKAVLKRSCQQLRNNMKSMNDLRSNLSLLQINEQIRTCLIQMDFKDQLELMTLANQMYAHFLKIERTPAQ